MKWNIFSFWLAVLALTLIPLALNGCGTDTGDDKSDSTFLTQSGAYVVGPEYRYKTPPSSLSSCTSASAGCGS